MQTYRTKQRPEERASVVNHLDRYESQWRQTGGAASRGTKVEKENMGRHVKAQNEGGRRRIHACPFEQLSSHTMFRDLRNHVIDKHPSASREGMASRMGKV